MRWTKLASAWALVVVAGLYSASLVPSWHLGTMLWPWAAIGSFLALALLLWQTPDDVDFDVWRRFPTWTVVGCAFFAISVMGNTIYLGDEIAVRDGRLAMRQDSRWTSISEDEPARQMDMKLRLGLGLVLPGFLFLVLANRRRGG